MPWASQNLCIVTYKQFVRHLFMEDIVQDALKVQSSLLPCRKQ